MYCLLVLTILVSRGFTMITHDNLDVTTSPSLGLLPVRAVDCQDVRMRSSMHQAVDSDQCQSTQSMVESVTKYVKVIARTSVRPERIVHCQLSFVERIAYCGTFSHTSDVAQGLSHHVVRLGPTECRQLHARREYSPREGIIIAIERINSTTRSSVTFAGRLDINGYCEGTSFTRGDTAYDHVIVTRSYTVTLSETWADYQLTSSRMAVAGDLGCAYNEGYCYDPLTGDHVWDAQLSSDGCDGTGWGIVFEGEATVSKVLSLNTNKSTPILQGVTQDTAFALALTYQDYLCNTPVWYVESTSLVVLEESVGSKLGRVIRTKHAMRLTDLGPQINSQILMVQLHTSKTMEAMAFHLETTRCKIDLASKVSKITQASTTHQMVFWEKSLEGVSYILSRGEAIQLISCPVVEVQVDPQPDCYADLPVMYNNKTLFVEPLTRRLKLSSPKITCTLLTPPLWKLGSSWFSLNPSLVHVASPMPWSSIGSASVMSPTGVYTSSGLYAEKEVTNMLTSHMTGQLRESYSDTSIEDHGSYVSIGLGKDSTQGFDLQKPGVLGMVSGFGQALVYTTALVCAILALHIVGALNKLVAYLRTWSCRGKMPVYSSPTTSAQAHASSQPLTTKSLIA